MRQICKGEAREQVRQTHEGALHECAMSNQIGFESMIATRGIAWVLQQGVLCYGHGWHNRENCDIKGQYRVSVPVTDQQTYQQDPEGLRRDRYQISSMSIGWHHINVGQLELDRLPLFFSFSIPPPPFPPWACTFASTLSRFYGPWQPQGLGDW